MGSEAEVTLSPPRNLILLIGGFHFLGCLEDEWRAATKRKPRGPKEEGTLVHRKACQDSQGKVAREGLPRSLGAGAGSNQIQASPRRVSLVSMGPSSVTAGRFVSPKSGERYRG